MRSFFAIAPIVAVMWLAAPVMPAVAESADDMFKRHERCSAQFKACQTRSSEMMCTLGYAACIHPPANTTGQPAARNRETPTRATARPRTQRDRDFDLGNDDLNW